MILSAPEFRRLRTSEDPAEYARAAHDEAPDAVWREIIETDPDMREWVALNATVPLPILATLARDDNPRVRMLVAMKRKLDPSLFALLATDPDASVRQRLAYNAKTPADILATLATDADPLVALAAQKALAPS